MQKGPVLSKEKFRIGVGLPSMDETGHKIEVQIKFFLHSFPEDYPAEDSRNFVWSAWSLIGWLGELSDSPVLFGTCGLIFELAFCCSRLLTY